MSAPREPYWEGPYLFPEELDNATRQGDVCIDDVGTMRQRRYGNTHMGGGWTQYGCDPLTSRELLENGTRPAWVLRFKEEQA